MHHLCPLPSPNACRVITSPAVCHHHPGHGPQPGTCCSALRTPLLSSLNAGFRKGRPLWSRPRPSVTPCSSAPSFLPLQAWVGGHLSLCGPARCGLSHADVSGGPRAPRPGCPSPGHPAPLQTPQPTVQPAASSSLPGVSEPASPPPPTQLHQLSTKPGPPTRGPSPTGRNPAWPSCWPHLSHLSCHQILSPLPQESSSASCAAPTSPQSSPGAIASAVRGPCKLVPIRRQCQGKTPLACPWALDSVQRPSHGTERFLPHLGCMQCPPLSSASMALTVRVPCSGSRLWPLRQPGPSSGCLSLAGIPSYSAPILSLLSLAFRG